MISIKELKYILKNNNPHFVEGLAKKARKTTIQYFGKTISLYAPLYLSNYCENQCIYCGFQTKTKLKRKKLSIREMNKEMEIISKSGIRNILLLTGESQKMAPVGYILEAVNIAKNYFSSISLEVYPLEVEEYQKQFQNGVDGVTIYQETYSREQYKKLHLSGNKTNYDFRYKTPERLAKSGIRMIGMGVLLGLSTISEDVYELFRHLEQMEKKYPGIEYSLSFPRLIPPINGNFEYIAVSDLTLVKLICMARILFPRVGITLSTREKPHLRDHVILLGVTKISAASKTSVGGYAGVNEQNPQFEVQDNRSVREIISLIKQKGYDPVFTDWRRIENSSG